MTSKPGAQGHGRPRRGFVSSDDAFRDSVAIEDRPDVSIARWETRA